MASKNGMVAVTFSTRSDRALLDTTTTDASITVAEFKIVLIGDFAVGKTSFLSQYCDQTFDQSVTSTVGVDFRTIDYKRSGDRIDLQLWDTAGEERYHSMTTTYYRGASGFIVLFDLTNQNSFDNCTRWLDEIALKCSGEQYSVILVGSKLDLYSKRTVNIDEAEQLAASKDIKYFECSSKENINVKEAIDSLVSSIIQRMKVTASSTDEHIDESETNSSSCYC